MWRFYIGNLSHPSHFKFTIQTYIISFCQHVWFFLYFSPACSVVHVQLVIGKLIVKTLNLLTGKEDFQSNVITFNIISLRIQELLRLSYKLPSTTRNYQILWKIHKIIATRYPFHCLSIEHITHFLVIAIFLRISTKSTIFKSNLFSSTVWFSNCGRTVLRCRT